MSTTTDPAQQYGGDTIKRMRSSHSTSSAHLDRFSDEVKDDATEEAFCDKELSEQNVKESPYACLSPRAYGKVRICVAVEPKNISNFEQNFLINTGCGNYVFKPI